MMLPFALAPTEVYQSRVFGPHRLVLRRCSSVPGNGTTWMPNIEMPMPVFVEVLPLTAATPCTLMAAPRVSLMMLPRMAVPREASRYMPLSPQLRIQFCAMVTARWAPRRLGPQMPWPKPSIQLTVMLPSASR